jgi:hypothetical protein
VDGRRLRAWLDRTFGAGERRLSALRRRHVGFAFQFFHLVPELSGEANVQLAARVRGARSDARARGRALVDRLGLREAAESFPHQLWCGEQQRFAIARALVNDPSLLLADEPTGNLDLQSGAGVLALLHELSREGAVRAAAPRAQPPRAARDLRRLARGRDRGDRRLRLATGFDRAARKADLPDLIARFDEESRDTVDARVRRPRARARHGRPARRLARAAAPRPARLAACRARARERPGAARLQPQPARQHGRRRAGAGGRWMRRPASSRW